MALLEQPSLHSGFQADSEETDVIRKRRLTASQQRRAAFSGLDRIRDTKELRPEADAITAYIHSLEAIVKIMGG